MTTLPRRLLRLLTAGGQPDSAAALLERQAREEPSVPPEPSAAEGAARRRVLAQPPKQVLQDQMAAKLLHAWLQNRHQTLFPLSLNLRNLPPAQRHLLIHSLVASARMTGIAATALPPLLPAIGGQNEAETLQAALGHPCPLADLLEALREQELGAYAYTLALLVGSAGRGGLVEAWLNYLAFFFALPAEVLADLRRRGGWRRITPSR
ncbi:hypothetical protein [Teichococcus deserti]|nr:hypothetical protein [Pseudoroseomonas deserti]